jgi:outer membrane protein assembly factor BamB
VYLVAGAEEAPAEIRLRLVALDPGGHPKPGWPIDGPLGADFGGPAVGPDGSIYFHACDAPRGGCVLHRVDASSRELPGWPFEVPPPFDCPSSALCHSLLDIGSDGAVVLTRWRDAGGLEAIAIDAAGRVRPGWPVFPDPAGMWWSNAKLASDGTLFMMARPDGSDKPARLGRFGVDGRPVPGWPVAIPDIRDYVLGPEGTVVTWEHVDDVGELCPAPRRTVFTVWDQDGEALAGWPRGSRGFASMPAVGADGTVYYVSQLGNVYAHDRGGDVKAGWPFAAPGGGSGCGPASPYIAPDGRIFVLADVVEARSTDGSSRPGWPYRPAGNLLGPALDTDGGVIPKAPAFGPDGTVYLVEFHTDGAGVRAEVVALDLDGRLKAGWPFRLPFDPIADEISLLTVSPDGRLYVRGGDTLLALDPDGRLSR